MRLDFRILGPLEVASADGPIRLGGPRQRSVLALLLLDANRIVSIDRLADALYGEAPPVSAVTQVHRQISELRALLGPERIETRPPGYRVLIEPDALDLRVFERLADEAATARSAGEPAEAVRLYRAALALWRGDPLGDLAFEPFVRPISERLHELRLTVCERCLDAELELGRSAELIAELEALVHEAPLREPVRGQLMLALYRAGRQTDALAVFRAGRDALVEAFGLEPTPALKELEGRILRHDPGLLGPEGSRPAAPKEQQRIVLLAARDGSALDGLVAIGGRLGALGRHELLVTLAVEDEQQLADAVAETRALRAELTRSGVTSRAAAYVSQAFPADVARLALTHDADLLVTPAPAELEREGIVSDDLRLLLEHAPCDVALLGSGAPAVERGIAVLFGGGEHDWAAAELGAWLAADATTPLQLVGARGASRLLASASIAIQQLAGIDVEPILADADGLVEAAGRAGLLVLGFSPRFAREGLGASRRALLGSCTAALIVHRGARPGGLAPRESLTRFTWTIAAHGRSAAEAEGSEVGEAERAL